MQQCFHCIYPSSDQSTFSASRNGKITVYFRTIACATLVNVDDLDSNYFSMCNGEASISVNWIVVDHTPDIGSFCTVASFDTEKYMALLKVQMVTFLFIR